MTRTLSRPPGPAALYPRALAGALARAVPVVRSRLAAHTLPDIELALRDVEVDPGHLSRYADVCGFASDARLPATYPHVIAFPLALRIMTSASFPFGVLGLVHIDNEIVQRRPVAPGERLSFRVRAEALEPHDRGTRFTIAADADVDGAPVWEERSVYLHRERGPGSGRRGKPDAPPPARSHWRIPEDIGRRYGAVSGDRNPIHLHPLSARLFGMPRPIAHGMWLQARCLAELESELPDAFTTGAHFKLPVALPAQVAFGTRGDGTFALTDASSGRPHVVGSVTPADPAGSPTRSDVTGSVSPRR